MAPPQQVEDEAFITLATNDTYSLGCLVLGHSLRRVNTTRKLVVMVTPGVTEGMRRQLADVFDMITTVDVLDSRDTQNLELLTRPDLGVTFTKLHCWRLTQFKKGVFLDADTMVLQNVDDLFDREELSAAPDAGWPDCFNSGVFVFRPSLETYKSLLHFALTQGSFDGGDQGLLNLYFHDWAHKDISKHLPFLYNVVSQAFYSYLPAFVKFGQNIKIVHFIGEVKPWHHRYNTATGKVIPESGTGHSLEFLQMWWDIFMTSVQPTIDPSLHVYHTLRLYAEMHEYAPAYYHNPHPAAPPEEEHHMTMPYIPPTIDEIFYEPQNYQHEQYEEHIVPEPEPRIFHSFENFYVEPPMSHYQEEAPPPEVYTAKNFEQEWAPPPEPPHQPEPVWVPEPTPDPGPQPSEAPAPPTQPEEVPDLSQQDHSNVDNNTNIDQNAQNNELPQTDSIEHQDLGSNIDEHSIKTDSAYIEKSVDDDEDEEKEKQDEEESEEWDSDPDEYFFSTDSELEEEIDSGNGSPGTESPEPIEIIKPVSDETEIKPKESGLAGELAQLHLTAGGGQEVPQLTETQRRERWERGQADYLGEDSFENIQKKIDQTIKKKDEPAPKVPTTKTASK